MLLVSYLLGGGLMPKQTLFVVTDELQQALDQLPPDQQRRSRLEPLKTFILRWRRQGRTYRRIAEILTVNCKLPVSHIAVRKFVKRCGRPRKPKLELELDEPITPDPVQRTLQELQATPRIHTKLSPEEAARQRAVLQSLRNKPAIAPKPAVLVEFEYDEDKGVTIDRTKKE